MNYQDIQVETFHNYLIMQQRVLREKEENEFLLAAKPLTVTAVDTIESIA